MTSKQKHGKNQDLFAILAVTFGYFSYSVMDAFAKFLTTDFSIMQITSTINGLSAILLGIIIFKKHGMNGFKVEKPHLHLLRTFLFLWVPYFALKALSILELTEFYSVVFMTPILMIFASAIILKEPLDRTKVIMAFIGFLGVLIAIQGQIAQNTVGVLYVIGAVFFLVANTLVIRRIPTGKTPLTLSFYPALAFLIVYGAWALPSYTIPTDPQWVILFLAGLAVFGGQIGCVSGFTKASSTSTVAPFHYSQIIWGILFGYVIFDHIPSTSALIGTVLIIYSGLYIALFTKSKTTP